MRIFQFIKKNLPVLLVISMGLGLLKGYYAPMAFSKIICFTALMVMIYPVMINLRVERGFNIKGSLKPLLVSLLINFILSPLVAVLVSKLLFSSNPYAAIGLFMIGIIPTSGMTINWIHHMKADMHTGIVLVTINILATFLVVPIILPLLMKYVLLIDGVSIDSFLIIEKIAFVVLLPVLLGWLTRIIADRTIGEKKLSELMPFFSGISNFGLLFVMFLIMSLGTSQIVVSHFGQAIYVFLPIMLYYLIMLAIVILIIKNVFNSNQGYPVLFSTFLRYHIVSLGIALAAYGDTEEGVWVILTIISALIIQPLFVAILAGNYLKKIKFLN